jgi:hypothetical protein
MRDIIRPHLHHLISFAVVYSVCVISVVHADSTSQNHLSKEAPSPPERPLSKSAPVPMTLTARESALTPPKGSWSIGLFNPLSIQLSEKIGLTLHPLAVLAAPHFTLTHQWYKRGKYTLTGLYGLASPSWSLQRGLPFGVAGFFGPLCLVEEAEPDRNNSCQRSGLGVTPKIGATLSRKNAKSVWTFELDLAMGLLLSGDRPAPLHTHAPLEVLYSPLTNTYRMHVGGRYAHELTSTLSMATELDLYLVGAPSSRGQVAGPAVSPLTLSTYLGMDWMITHHFALTVGVMYWSSDQLSVEFQETSDGYQQKVRVRSHDFWPTFDLIWSY